MASSVVVASGIPRLQTFTLFDVPGHRWKIMEASEQPASVAQKEGFVRSDSFPALSHSYFENLRMTEILRKDVVRVNDFEFEGDKSERRVRVSFDWLDGTSNSGLEAPFKRGSGVFLIDRHFAMKYLEIVSVLTKTAEESVHKLSVEYQSDRTDDSGIPVVKKATVELKNSKLGWVSTRAGTVINVNFRPVLDRNEFSISAFDLKSPTPAFSVHPVLWINLLLILVVVGRVILIGIRKRRRVGSHAH